MPCGHRHAGDAADGHDGADKPTVPAMREQKNAQERSDPGLHVGHEEVEGLQRDNGPRSQFVGRKYGHAMSETARNF